MLYYVDGKAKISGDGTKEHPFRTISEAAVRAEAGDEVVVLPGVSTWIPHREERRKSGSSTGLLRRARR